MHNTLKDVCKHPLYNSTPQSNDIVLPSMSFIFRNDVFYKSKFHKKYNINAPFYNGHFAVKIVMAIAKVYLI